MILAALVAASLAMPVRPVMRPQPARPARQEVVQLITPVRAVTWAQIKRRWRP